MENKYLNLTKNVLIGESKYAENGVDYYFKNEYGLVHIRTDNLTPSDFRAIADHLESCSKNDPILYGGESPELEIEININWMAKVKLTEEGRKYLAEYYAGYKGVLSSYVPEVDKDGYLTLQLWEVMQIVGRKVMMGGSLMFETEIVILKEEKS